MAGHVAEALGETGGPVSFAPSHTYAANPLAAAAGLAAVTLFREGGYQERIAELAAYTEPRLRALAEAHGATLRAVGLLYGVKLTAAAEDAERLGERVASACLRRGLIIRGQDDWVVLAPAFVTTPAEVDEILGILGEALDEVRGAGR